MKEFKQLNYFWSISIKDYRDTTSIKIDDLEDVLDIIRELFAAIFICFVYIIIVVSFRLWWPLINMKMLKYFELDDLETMCEGLGEFIDIWWDSNKIDLDKSGVRALFKHCSQFKDVWEKDYIVWKLQQ